jgi:putative RNA 2'-phosphotransferase
MKRWVVVCLRRTSKTNGNFIWSIKVRDKLVRASKFIGLVLRHQPRKFGVVLDDNGWTSVDSLIVAARAADVPLGLATLQRIVAENVKQRFCFNDDGDRVWANQGNSVNVDLALAPRLPPPVLFHGTATRFINAIRAEGLCHQSWRHVHLSVDATTAAKVGLRHGKSVVLQIRAGEVQAAGGLFFLSDNGAWLTEYVPVVYIDLDGP